MGIVKDIKIQKAADAAAAAEKAGRGVLAYRQNIPMSKSGWSGDIPDMGEVIDAIERRGWRLDQMAFDGHQSSNGGCILIFRRAAPAKPAAASAAPQQQPRQVPEPSRPAAPAQQYGAQQTPPQWQPQPQSQYRQGW